MTSNNILSVSDSFWYCHNWGIFTNSIFFSCSDISTKINTCYFDISYILTKLSPISHFVTKEELFAFTILDGDFGAKRNDSPNSELAFKLCTCILQPINNIIMHKQNQIFVKMDAWEQTLELEDAQTERGEASAAEYCCEEALGKIVERAQHAILVSIFCKKIWCCLKEEAFVTSLSHLILFWGWQWDWGDSR